MQEAAVIARYEDQDTARPKANLGDLSAIRERYTAIMEEQVILPFLRDLREHRAELEAKLAGDLEETAERALRAELERVGRLISVASAAAFKMDEVQVERLAQVFAGR